MKHLPSPAQKMITKMVPKAKGRRESVEELQIATIGKPRKEIDSAIKSRVLSEVLPERSRSLEMPVHAPLAEIDVNAEEDDEVIEEEYNLTSELEVKMETMARFKSLIKKLIKQKMTPKLSMLKGVSPEWMVSKEDAVERWPAPSVPVGFKPFIHSHMDMVRIRSMVVALGFEVVAKSTTEVKILDNPKAMRSPFFIPNFEIMTTMTFKSQHLQCEAIQTAWEEMWYASPVIRLPLHPKFKSMIEEWRLPMIAQKRGKHVDIKEFAETMVESCGVKSCSHVFMKIIPNMDSRGNMSYIYEYDV